MSYTLKQELEKLNETIKCNYSTIKDMDQIIHNKNKLILEQQLNIDNLNTSSITLHNLITELQTKNNELLETIKIQEKYYIF